LPYLAVAFNLEIPSAVLDQQFPMTCAKVHIMQTSRPFSSGVWSTGTYGFCEITTQNSSQQHGLMRLESESADLPSGPRHSLFATGPTDLCLFGTPTSRHHPHAPPSSAAIDVGHCKASLLFWPIDTI